MDFQQNNVQPQMDNNNQYSASPDSINDVSNDNSQYISSEENTVQNTDADIQTALENNGSAQTQEQPSEETTVQSPYQTKPPYGNDGMYPYTNNTGNSSPTNGGYNNGSYGNNSYINNNNNAYGNGSYNNYNNVNNNNLYNNNGYNNYNVNNVNNRYNNYNSYNNNVYNGGGYNYNNNYRSLYPAKVSEPGSSLADAAVILGIISIISCFTFTVYPAFITGSIAIVLALLSKGRRPRLLNKARTGIICAVSGLILNTALITGGIILLFTNPDVKDKVNQTFQEQYGQSFDEMLEEILEESGYYD